MLQDSPPKLLESLASESTLKHRLLHVKLSRHAYQRYHESFVESPFAVAEMCDTTAMSFLPRTRRSRRSARGATSACPASNMVRRGVSWSPPLTRVREMATESSGSTASMTSCASRSLRRLYAASMPATIRDRDNAVCAKPLVRPAPLRRGPPWAWCPRDLPRPRPPRPRLGPLAAAAAPPPCPNGLPPSVKKENM